MPGVVRDAFCCLSFLIFSLFLFCECSNISNALFSSESGRALAFFSFSSQFFSVLAFIVCLVSSVMATLCFLFVVETSDIATYNFHSALSHEY